jgi:putative MATE family efflux protein
MSRTLSLTEDSVGRGLFHFALPILFVNVLSSVNGSVNSVWLGHFLGEAALSAATNVNTTMSVLIAAVSGIGMAANILIGQHIGAGDLASAKRVLGTGMTLSLLLSACVSGVGIALSRQLLSFMGTPSQAVAVGIPYMRVIFLAVPVLYLNGFLTSVLRAAGDSRTPVRFTLLCVALDIALNPVFIFGVGPISRMGVAGSAMATVLADVISVAAMISHLYRQKHVLCLRRHELTLLRADFAILARLMATGIPMSAQMFLLSFSAALMLTLVNRFGANAVAAFAIVLQVLSYVQMPAVAVATAVTSMAAQNVGARRWGRVDSIALAGVFYNVIITAAAVAVIELMDMRLFGLFVPGDSPALQIASHINGIVSWSFILMGTTVVLFSVVCSAGAVVQPLIISSVSLLLVRFPLAASLLSAWHADAIWWSFPISAAVSLTLAALYYRYGHWRAVA